MVPRHLHLFTETTPWRICSSSLIANEHNAWYVCGSKGIMEIRGVSRLLTIDIYNNKRELVKHYDAPKMISGYEYELLACKKALEEGRLECSEIPHAETLRIMKLLDELRSKIGITFPSKNNQYLISLI